MNGWMDGRIANASLHKVEMPDPVRSDGWMDRQCKFQRGCKFTHKFPLWKFTQMPDPVRSDGWMDGQKKRRRQMQAYKTKSEDARSGPIRWMDGWTTNVKIANASLHTKLTSIRSDQMDGWMDGWTDGQKK